MSRTGADVMEDVGVIDPPRVRAEGMPGLPRRGTAATPQGTHLEVTVGMNLSELRATADRQLRAQLPTLLQKPVVVVIGVVLAACAIAVVLVSLLPSSPSSAIF
jgi:hypothetical protein